ncbi:MAG: TolC family protein [Acidobacteriota bacterium]
MRTLLSPALLGIALACTGSAQTLTIEAVVAAASQHPSVDAARSRSESAAAAIRVARTAFLPQVSALAQLNRATTNNVYGMLFPQQVIAPISGPPVLENRATNVFGSAIGTLVSWDAFDFGLRQAAVATEEAAKRRADAAIDVRRFELGAAAADAFLTVLAAERQEQAARAGVDRAEVFLRSVSALTRAGLRPGAEEARAQAERAASDVRWIQAKQAVAVARAALAEFTQTPDSALEERRLLSGAPGDLIQGTATHPVLQEQQLAIEESQSRTKVIEYSALPKITLQGTTYARGTGAHPDLTTGGIGSGILPTFVNWGLGVSVSWNFTARRVAAEKKGVELAQEQGERARLATFQRELDTSRRKAQATLEGSRQIAAAIPQQLSAARATEQQATSRYQAGLGTISDVAEAQQLLTRAEIDDALAKLSVWRALLGVAFAAGNLQPFLEAAR